MLRLLWLLPALFLILTGLLVWASTYATACASHRHKNITYVPANTPGFDPERHRLDVYVPRKRSTTLRPVVVFIHGGSWNSGSKNLYSFVGRRLAKGGADEAVVSVLINYRLSPGVRVPDMADDCARALIWTKQHIADYGGDPARIYVMGHSAGGGLAALLATDDTLFRRWGESKNPVKGAILDDPAGLDMLTYLTKREYPNDDQYLIPFGTDPAIWRSTSALYHLRPDSPPVLLYVGGRTYPGIATSTRTFRQRLQELNVSHSFVLMPRKKHIGMATQLFWSSNRIYRDLRRFVRTDPATWRPTPE